ncbi:MAG TPA: hypothetical protein VLB44_12210 [Kofleriaceae bacterium]|nr:hypothetical protein [Kofleriaceae bacterium]
MRGGLVVLVTVLVIAGSGCSFIMSRPHPEKPNACSVVPPAIDGAIAIAALLSIPIAAATTSGEIGVAAIMGTTVPPVVAASLLSALYGAANSKECSDIEEARERAEKKKRETNEVEEELVVDAHRRSDADCTWIAGQFNKLDDRDPAVANRVYLASARVRDCLEAHDEIRKDTTRVETAQQHPSETYKACSAARSKAFVDLTTTDAEQRKALVVELPVCTGGPDVIEQSWAATREAVVAALAGDCAAVEHLSVRVRELDRAHHDGVFSTQPDIATCLAQRAREDALERAERLGACKKERARRQLEASAIADLRERTRALQDLPKCEQSP